MNPIARALALTALPLLLLLPSPASAAGRIAGAEPVAEPGEPFVSFARGTGENEAGLHLDPGGAVPFGLFNGPASFVVHDGTVHLLDTLNGRILRAGKGGPIGQTPLPKGALGVDLALSGKNYVVADASGPRVLLLDASGKTIAAMGGPGEAPGLFRQVDQVGVTNAGEILAVDWGNDGAVSRFSGEGIFLAREAPGTAPFTGPSGKRFRLEFHADTGAFALFRAAADGQTEEALFKMEGGKSGANLAVAGVDAKGRAYLKRFRPPEVEILRLDATGKTESRHPAPLDPGFDAARHHAVDPVTGEVYALAVRDKTVVILRLPAASARAN